MNFKQILCAGAVTVLFASGINSSTVHAFDNINSAQTAVEENKPNVTSEIEDSEIINIVDQELLACVNKTLGRKWERFHPVTKTEAASIDNLKCGQLDVSDLTGIEHFVGLETLSMIHSNISDVSVFEKAVFPNMRFMYLGNNKIETLSAFNKNSFPKLENLSINNNNIVDISPIKHLSQELKFAGISENLITDISSLGHVGSNLPNLYNLNLRANKITKLFDFEQNSFPNLKELVLRNNAITDISPLKNVPKKISLDLSDQQIVLPNALVGEMQTQNIVYIDGQIAGLSFNETSPEFVEQVDSNTWFFKKQGTENIMWYLFSQHNNNFSGTITQTSVPNPEVINIVDRNLLACVNQTLAQDRGSNWFVTKTEAATINTLACDKQNVSNLTGIEHFVALENLSISNNNISDLSVFEKAIFPNMRSILLDNNKIETLSAFNKNSFPKLETINLSNNNIVDISPLKQFPQSVNLDVSDQKIMLPHASLGERQTQNIVDIDGQIISLNFDEVDPKIVEQVDSNTWFFKEPGTANITWQGLALHGNNFFGTITQTGALDSDIIINIIDKTFLACVNELLGSKREPDSPVTKAEAVTIKTLNCDEISELTGIEHFVALEELRTRNGYIRDVSVLEKAIFPNMHSILLANNKIATLSAFNKHSFPNLENLDLSNNNIVDISFLKNLSDKLTILEISSNSITNISDLQEIVSSLPNLKQINFNENKITQLFNCDKHSFANLNELNLINNAITDISGLKKCAETIAFHVGNQNIYLPDAELKTKQSINLTGLDSQPVLLDTCETLGEPSNIEFVRGVNEWMFKGHDYIQCSWKTNDLMFSGFVHQGTLR